MTKSPIDDRNYRVLTLKNGIRCILVEDADVQKSAACLFVYRGSLSDPQGVADQNGVFR